MRNHWNNFWK